MSDKIKVMIIDDHDIVRQGLIVLLDNFDDFDVVADVGDARLGVDMCVQLQPQVVLMDIVMPIMDGITATKLIHQKCPNTQVIALTSFNDEDNVQQALQAGAISYLMKNVSIDELANAVKKAAQGVPTLSPEATRSLINASTRPPQLGYNLTSRELEVLALMAQGLNNREIGEKLFISAATVKNHVSNILDKLGTTSRTQAVALAVENKMM
jgi:two-component system, NarL family, response regulator LiaR